MSVDDLERILAQESGIEPSAGFTASVMAAVRREAAAPAPLAFPWRLAAPALALSALLVLGFVFAAASSGGWSTIAAGETPLPLSSQAVVWTTLVVVGALLLAFMTLRYADPAGIADLREG